MRSKEWRALALLVLCLLSLIVCFALGTESGKYLLFNGQTIYSTGYTEKNFKKICVGMRQEDVHGLLGPPLRRESVKFLNRWEYYPESTSETSVFNLFGPFTHIYFDPNQTVCAFEGNFLDNVTCGIAQKDVQQKYGAPASITAQSRADKLVYSQSARSGTYKVRTVWIDSSGAVLKVEKGMCFD